LLCLLMWAYSFIFRHCSCHIAIPTQNSEQWRKPVRSRPRIHTQFSTRVYFFPVSRSVIIFVI
jgi:hypothetical protein